MPNLVPEVRVNKNGVPVTKHVNPARKRRDTSGVPAPESSVQKVNQDTSAELSDCVRSAHRNGGSGFMDLRPVTELLLWQEQMSDATQEAYLEAIHARPDDGYEELLLGVLNESIPDAVARYYLEITKLDPEQRVIAKELGDAAYRRSSSVYRGLTHYEGFTPPSDITNGDDPATRVTMGLIRATHRLCNESEEYGFTSFFNPNPDAMYGHDHVVQLYPPEFARLVMERPEDSDRIADIVLARGTDDVDTIRAILEADTPQLSNGVL